MTVNHGGRLQPAYFKSYLTLIMSSRECSLDCAKEYTINTFFRGNPELYGGDSCNSFKEAVNSMRG